MSALPKRYFTVEEYLLLEGAVHRTKASGLLGKFSPWVNVRRGVLPTWAARSRIMSPIGPRTSPPNCTAGFVARPCRVFNADMRVAIQSGEFYTYPDVSALCGEPKFDTGQNPQSLTNPQVIIEVLSPSTESFDRGEKFTRYQQLTSLCDYVLVSAQGGCRWNISAANLRGALVAGLLHPTRTVPLADQRGLRIAAGRNLRTANFPILFQSMKYLTTIGLEVHVQLKTHSKMFCGWRRRIRRARQRPHLPDLPRPAWLRVPVMNGHALELTTLTGLMLDCEIAPYCKFDRKNYFYPDMPKNYQISQYDLPICVGAWCRCTTWRTRRTRRKPSPRPTRKWASFASTWRTDR